MTTVRILSIDEPINHDEMDTLMDELRGAFDRAGLDGDEIVFINGDVEAIDKEELEDLL